MKKQLEGTAESTPLTFRELEVIRLIEREFNNKQIAGQLGISERTVKVHIGNVFRRIRVTDRISAAMWARDNLPAARQG